jgi:UDP-glucose 4-epimerase
MENQNILITGGCGYIGLHLSKLMKHYNIIIYDNLKFGNSYMNKFGKVYKGDLSEENKLDFLFKKYKFKLVIHLAGLAHISESIEDPKLYYYNNLILSIKLLNIAVKYEIKYFIFSSSCTVYGNHLLKNDKQHKMKEDDFIKPINPYGNTKMMFESILIDYSNKYNFNYSILRYFNACGSDPEFEVGEYHQNEKRIIPRIIKYSLGLIDNFCIFGNDYDTKDGTAVRDYTHVMDIAKAHLCALNYMINLKKSLVCNIGSGKGYSINDLIKLVEKISEKKLEIKIKKRREGDSGYMVCSNKLAKKLLKWEPEFTIEDIIYTSYQWYSIHLPKIKDFLHLERIYNI